MGAVGQALIAVRVSPRPQDKVRYSPEIQERACREWCDQHGLDVVGVISDILVSGGDASRFDSVFAALEEHPETGYFVVSDSSRWTRDEPWRFWTIYGVLRERGIVVRFADASEQHMNDDSMPFWASMTTMRVEANYQERLTLKRKTAAGVRRAWAAGKRWGHRYGWTWDPELRRFHIDRARVERLYELWNAGESTPRIARELGVWPTSIPKMVQAIAQREVVGDAVWELAQSRLKSARAGRGDATKSNIYRGLLRCPADGHILNQSSRWGHYYCNAPYHAGAWRSVSAGRYVTPPLAAILSGAALEAPAPEVARVDVTDQIERLTEAWVLGRISQARYDSLMADLEAQQSAPPPRSQEQVEEALLSLSEVDLTERDPEGGDLINRLLRELFIEIRLDDARVPSFIPREDYRAVLHL